MAAAIPQPPQTSEAYPSMKAVIEKPFSLRGTVVKGFGRGSKELGIPTANLDADALAAAGCLEGVEPGVYFGWASVGGSEEVFKMVMSIGWNPFYKNERKTVEPHLLHSFDSDFYGSELRLLVTGYLRPEQNYSSLDALIAAINLDIDTAKAQLDTEGQQELKGNEEGKKALKPSSSTAEA